MTSIEGVYIKRKQADKGAANYVGNDGGPSGAQSHQKALADGNGSGTLSYEYQIEPYLSQPSCDFSLQFLVNKMLPLCNNHDFI